jgi:hypothetical protein
MVGDEPIIGDEDLMFEFIRGLPVCRKMFNGQLLLHVDTSKPRGGEPRRLFVASKFFRPVCTVVCKGPSGAVEEMCHFALPCTAARKVTAKYLAGFQAAARKTPRFATLIWLVVSTFGLTSRTAVTVRWFSTPKLGAMYAPPSPAFVHALNSGACRGFDKFLFCIPSNASAATKIRHMYARLVLRGTHTAPSEEGVEEYMRVRDSTLLIRSAESHDYTDSPYFSDQLIKFIAEEDHRQDAVDLYGYVTLQRMWGDEDCGAGLDVSEVLTPTSRRSWHAHGYLEMKSLGRQGGADR